MGRFWIPMNNIFQTAFLSPKQAREAYPLVRLFHPALSLEKWLAFARRWRRMLRHRGGLVAMKDMRGYVHAVFSYRVDSNLRNEPVLRVSDLVVGRLPGRLIDRALVESVERLAREIGCTSILFELPQSREGNVDPSNRSALAKAGYEPCAISFLRRQTASKHDHAVSAV
jgi:hypothetical protein